MGSGTSMLDRNPQRERLREGKEPGAWEGGPEVQRGPVPGDEGGGAEAGRDVMKGGGWEESGRGYQDVLCLWLQKKEGRRERERERRGWKAKVVQVLKDAVF